MAKERFHQASNGLGKYEDVKGCGMKASMRYAHVDDYDGFSVGEKSPRKESSTVHRPVFENGRFVGVIKVEGE